MNRNDLIKHIRDKKSYLCVGLDPEMNQLPLGLSKNPAGLLSFVKKIIDCTKDYCVAFKPNLAFYEALGPVGWDMLYETINYIPSSHFIIADAKRGDIGNTCDMYAKAFFQTMKVDSITLAPYMGKDSIDPFLKYNDKWSIILGLTSNQSAADFQYLEDKKGQPLYKHVIKTASKWGNDANMMFVVGATKAEMLQEIREIIPNHFLLVPGVGAQGGSLSHVVKFGKNEDIGLLINSSRGIIYASDGLDFEEKAAVEAKKMAIEMASLL